MSADVFGGDGFFFLLYLVSFVVVIWAVADIARQPQWKMSTGKEGRVDRALRARMAALRRGRGGRRRRSTSAPFDRDSTPDPIWWRSGAAGLACYGHDERVPMRTLTRTRRTGPSRCPCTTTHCNSATSSSSRRSQGTAAEPPPGRSVPPGGDAGRRDVPGDLRRAAPRRQRPAEPGDVLPDLGGGRGPPADGPVDQQEHDRQGRVPPDGGDRATVCPDAGRPVERPRRGRGRRLLGHRVVRGMHARRHGRQVALAGQARGGGQAHGQAQHGVRSGAGRLAQVRQVLGHRDPRGPDVPGQVLHGRRADAGAGRREHHHGRAHLRGDLHRRVRARRRAGRGTRQARRRRPASTSTSTSTVPAAPSSAPFCAPEVVWDFRLPRVKSISTSGHKFGLAPLGVGWVLWRHAEELPDDLIFHVTYLGGDMPVFQINFSRPAGQIVAQYYNFVRLGREGYRDVHTPATRSASSWPPRSSSSGPSRCSATPIRRRHTVGGVEDLRGSRPRLHPLRRRRPARGRGLAGAGVPPDRLRCPTSRSNGSWSARGSAATWPPSCSPT